MTARILTKSKTLAISAVLLASVSLSACAQITTNLEYGPSDGVQITSGDIQGLNLMVLTSSEGEPGVLLGAIRNKSTSAVEATIVTADGTVLVLEEIAGNDTLNFHTNDKDFNLAATPAAPGSNIQATISDGNISETLHIPVLDGTLSEYKEFVPKG